MRRIYGNELKKIKLEILDVVVSFCEKNGISYWLDGGTLLGSVRHKGYIPWDDDIDVGMLRPDYDKFMRLFNQENDRYIFYSIENNPDFYYASGKVMDTNTILYEPDKAGTKLSINIDIDVYDNAPDSDKEVFKMYNKRDRLRRLHSMRTSAAMPRGNIIRRFCVRCLRMAMRIFPENYFIRKLSDNSKKYNKIDLNMVGNFNLYTRMVCGKYVFREFIDREFEGKLYKIPIGYDEWLSKFYGEYMELPPKEQRVSHHMFEAYVQE